MELSWLQSLVMGLFSGLTDILPVSSQAHQTLLLTLFGKSALEPMHRLIIHGATLITLLITCWGQIARIRREVRLTRLPRRRRNRAVDLAAIMDSKILQTALWPILAAMLLRSVLSGFTVSLPWLCLLSLVNAVILYLPGLFRTGNKDSRLVTPGEGLQMGAAAGLSILPGISSVGAGYSVGILHGIDRGYMIHLALMMHMMVTFGLIVYDVLAVLAVGSVASDTNALIGYGITALATAVGTWLGIRILRGAASEHGLNGFSFYSFGVALFTFILYLMV